MMSLILPALTLPPNPPVPVGHRKPRHAAPNPATEKPTVVEDAAVEELAAGDAELLLVDRLPY